MLNKDLFDVELNYTCVEGFLKSSASNETEFLLQTLNLNSLYLCNPLSYTLYISRLFDNTEFVV